MEKELSSKGEGSVQKDVFRNKELEKKLSSINKELTKLKRDQKKHILTNYPIS